MSGSHPLEGDGLIINIYFYLWKKKINALNTGLGVKIPPTVVYEHNFPKGWYFWSEKKEEIERKVGKEIDTKAIFKEFSRKHKRMQDLDVVASYMSRAEDATGQEQTVVEYFDREALHNFLTKRAKRDQGILQRFIPPNGKHNVTIQAIWSPHVTMVEKRQNIYALNDKRYDAFERTVTYEGPSHYSREAFVAPHIKAQIKNYCTAFTEHFKNTEHINISRMVLYFKVDRNSDVWLLWSSSLRISDKTQLNLAPQFVSPRRMKEEDQEKQQTEEAVLAMDVPTLGVLEDLYVPLLSRTSPRRGARSGSPSNGANSPPYSTNGTIGLGQAIQFPNFTPSGAVTARPSTAGTVTSGGLENGKEMIPQPPNTGRPSSSRPSTAPADMVAVAPPTEGFSTPRLVGKAGRHREAIITARTESLAQHQRNFQTSYLSAFTPLVLDSPRRKRKPRPRPAPPVTFAPVTTADETLPAAPHPAPPQRRKRTGPELWYIVRKAYDTKYTEVLHACDQLHEFVDGLCYSIYSHFLTNKRAFYFAMPPAITRFFGDMFFDRFQHLGVQKGDTAGDNVMYKPHISVVQLQQELQAWRDEVSKPLLDSEAIIFRDRVKNEMHSMKFTKKEDQRIPPGHMPRDVSLSIAASASGRSLSVHSEGASSSRRSQKSQSQRRSSGTGSAQRSDSGSSSGSSSGSDSDD